MSGPNPTEKPATQPTAFFHVSVHVYRLPPHGIDPNVDNLIERGELRDIVPGVMPSPVMRIDLPGAPTRQSLLPMRYGREKGKTYRRFPKGRKRAEWREIELRFPNHPIVPTHV